MASCGPSNPLQSMKNHLGRDATLQRDQVPAAQWSGTSAPGFRSRGTPPGGAAPAAAEFSAFNQFAPPLAPEHMRDPLAGTRAPPEPPAVVGYLSERDRALAPGTAAGRQWAAEFQRQDVPPALAPRAPAAFAPYAQPWAPSFAYAQPFASGPSVASGPSMATDAAFEEVFAAFEKRLAQSHPQAHPQSQSQPQSHSQPQSQSQSQSQPQLQPQSQPQSQQPQFLSHSHSQSLSPQPEQDRQQGPEPEEHVPQPRFDSPPHAYPEAVQSLRNDRTRADGEDLSRVAAEIISTLEAREGAGAPDLAEKMQASKFVALMGKLRTSEARASGSDFVAANGEPINPYALDAAQVASPGPTSQAHAEAARVAVDRVGAGADWPPRRREAPFGRSWRDAQYLMGLEDPDTYFKNLQESIRSSNETTAALPSPLEAAQALGPAPVHARDWEEDYENW